MPHTLDLAAIQHRIPHRAPILLLDRVLDWQGAPAEGHPWLLAERFFPESDPLFAGHFPGQPVLPGMLTYEAIAQSAALLVSLMRDLTAETATYLFMGISEAKLTRMVMPGQTVRFRSEKLFDKLGVFRFYGTAEADGQPVASCTFTAKLILK